MKRYLLILMTTVMLGAAKAQDPIIINFRGVLVWMKPNDSVVVHPSYISFNQGFKQVRCPDSIIRMLGGDTLPKDSVTFRYNSCRVNQVYIPLSKTTVIRVNVITVACGGAAGNLNPGLNGWPANIYFYDFKARKPGLVRIVNTDIYYWVF